MNKKSNNPLKTPAFMLILPVMILIVIIVSYIRKNSRTIFEQPQYQVTESDKKDWLDALKAGHQEKSLLHAARIVDDSTAELPDSDYIHILYEMRISTMLFTEPFNRNDYIAWRDALDAKKTVSELQSDSIEDIYAMLREKVEYKRFPDDYIPHQSAMDTFRNGSGNLKKKRRKKISKHKRRKQLKANRHKNK